MSASARSSRSAGAKSAAAIDQIETQLAVLVRQLDNFSRKAVTYLELDRASYLLARSLDDLGSVSIKGLAAALSLEPTTVTRKIATMEARGLIERATDDDDKRISLVRLSPLGLQKMRNVRELRRQHNAVLLAEWNQADLAHFGRLLKLYNETISGRQDLL